MTNNIFYKKRTDETFEALKSFYHSMNYRGEIENSNEYFLAYYEEKIIAIVRVAYENGIHVLRGMFVSPDFQKKGVGQSLLIYLTPFLDETCEICYCVPYSHLEKFYEKVGFKKMSLEKAPLLLVNRMKKYLSLGENTIIMSRFG